MIKYFCDVCGVEIKNYSYGAGTHNPYRAYDDDEKNKPFKFVVDFVKPEICCLHCSVALINIDVEKIRNDTVDKWIKESLVLQKKQEAKLKALRGGEDE